MAKNILGPRETRRCRNESIASRLLDSGIVGIEQGDRADHGSGRAQGVGEFLVGVRGSRDIGDMAEEIPCPLLDEAGCLARLPGTRRLGKAVRDDGGGRFARQASALSSVAALTVERSQVVEGFRHVGVVRAESLLADRQRTLVVRFRLAVLPLVFVQIGQVIEDLRHVRVIGAERLFADR